ncbi:hypothetical protein ABXS75_12310 [Roseburia hominis]
MNISRNIYYRFEENIDNGTLYIYIYDEEVVIKSKEFTYRVLKGIDQGSSIEKIEESLELWYESYSKKQIKELIGQVIEFLESHNIIYE